MLPLARGTAMITDKPEQVLEYIREQDCRSVGIDGVDHSGKAALARDLAMALGWPLFSLDDYLDGERGHFLEALRYEQLANELTLFPNFMLEGVCLLAAAERMNVTPDLCIYVKRVRHGIWIDEEAVAVAADDVEAHLLHERHSRQVLEGLQKPPAFLGLAEEVMRYHALYSPASNADVIFERRL